MERRIKNIFDYQRFSSNLRLSAMIADVEQRYAELSDNELSDEDLDFVNAAGDMYRLEEDEDDEHDEP